MTDEELFPTICRCVTIAFCVTVLTVGGCVANTHYQVTQALLKGVDPMQVACAQDTPSDETACHILAAKRP